MIREITVVLASFIIALRLACLPGGGAEAVDVEVAGTSAVLAAVAVASH
jgi:hypothetical protein